MTTWRDFIDALDWHVDRLTSGVDIAGENLAYTPHPWPSLPPRHRRIALAMHNRRRYPMVPAASFVTGRGRTVWVRNQRVVNHFYDESTLIRVATLAEATAERGL